MPCREQGVGAPRPHRQPEGCEVIVPVITRVPRRLPRCCILNVGRHRGTARETREGARENARPQALGKSPKGPQLSLLISRSIGSRVFGSIARKWAKPHRGRVRGSLLSGHVITLASLPLSSVGISSARAGRVSGGLVAGSRLQSVPVPGCRPTRRRLVTLRTACRRPRGRGPRPP